VRPVPTKRADQVGVPNRRALGFRKRVRGSDHAAGTAAKAPSFAPSPFRLSPRPSEREPHRRSGSLSRGGSLVGQRGRKQPRERGAAHVRYAKGAGLSQQIMLSASRAGLAESGSESCIQSNRTRDHSSGQANRQAHAHSRMRLHHEIEPDDGPPTATASDARPGQPVTRT